jgi:hypothetical protein
MLKQTFKKLTFPLANEQGDVPGWVLITLMTAGLVVVLWSVATPALSGILNQSLNKVANF